jgi:hypothetical protein
MSPEAGVDPTGNMLQLPAGAVAAICWSEISSYLTIGAYSVKVRFGAVSSLRLGSLRAEPHIFTNHRLEPTDRDQQPGRSIG